MKQNQIQGIVSLIFGTLLFSLWGVFPRLIGMDFGVFFQSLSRSSILLLILLPFLWWRRGWLKFEFSCFGDSLCSRFPRADLVAESLRALAGSVRLFSSHPGRSLPDRSGFPSLVGAERNLAHAPGTRFRRRSRLFGLCRKTEPFLIDRRCPDHFRGRPAQSHPVRKPF